MFGKTLGLTLCATLAVAQHIQYGPLVRLGGTTLTPAIDSGGNLLLLLMNLALGGGGAPTRAVLLVGRYERDGSSRLITDTGLAQPGNSPAFLALDDRDRVYVGVNRESQPVLARFGPGDARQQATLFVPFTRLVAVRFAPNGDPVVLGTDIAPGASTIQLVRLDAATLTPVARRLITGLPVSPRALAVDRTGAVYVAGSALARSLPSTPPSTAIGSADLGGAFVLKLSADLESIHYATVIGGRSPSGATAMEIAPDGSPYLAGYIVGGGGDNVFPTTPDAFQTRLPGERGLWVSGSGGFVTGPSAAFIARLSADGSSLLASTLLGGSVSDSINGIAFDEEGSVIAHGSTSSQDFPATGLFQTRCGPDRGPLFGATFITRLDARLRSVEKSVVASGVVSRGLPSGSIRGSIFLVLDDGVALVDLNRDEAVDVACVVSGASYRGLYYVVPGQLVTLFGRNIGPERLTAFETGEPLPSSIDGTEVLFNGVPAPILAGLSSQLNVVAPSSIGGGDVWLEVKRNGESVFLRPLRELGNRPEPMLQITADGRTIASPENRFALLSDVRNEDGSLNGPENPAAAGSLVTVFTTGLGELDAPLPDSGYGDGLARPVEDFAVDTSVGRLVPVETATLPGRTTAVSAVRFRVPETGGKILSFTIQPASSPSSGFSVPNFLYVRSGN